MKKIMLVFGTRPEAIKMAPLVKCFQKEKAIDTIICVTGQHREMLEQVLNIFDIIPTYDLKIMNQGQDLYDITSKVMNGMKEILRKESPDLVLVHGDTTTCMAVALSAFYQCIPVGHIEAGLRTYDMYSPWPEEVNRQLTTRIATYNFCPTELNRQNLLKENIKDGKIIVTGNTVIDALLWVLNKIKHSSELEKMLIEELRHTGYDVSRLSMGRRLVLITGHRRENFGEGFMNICNAIKVLGSKYQDVDFVYPMHLNPNVRGPIHKVFGDDLRNFENVFFIEPLEYLSFVYMMEKSYIILTDSGGIQEEAPSLGKPVLVMRNTTERPDALGSGTVRLVGSNYEKIIDEVSLLLDNEDEYDKMSKAVNPYGDGYASERIVKFIKGIL